MAVVRVAILIIGRDIIIVGIVGFKLVFLGLFQQQYQNWIAFRRVIAMGDMVYIPESRWDFAGLQGFQDLGPTHRSVSFKFVLIINADEIPNLHPSRWYMVFHQDLYRTACARLDPQ